MSKNILTVLESPWEDDDGDIAQHSMRPFVEGLAELNEWRLIYRTFTSSRELGRLLNGEGFHKQDTRSVAYLATHGGKGRLCAGIYDPEDINLASAADKIVRDVEGIWIGACDVGNSASLDRFLTGGGSFWAGGYCCSVDWDACMMIDLAVLHTVMQAKPVKTRSQAVDVLAAALRRFDPAWEIGVDEADDPVELGAALRVVARDSGGRPSDVTQAIKDELGWALEETE